MWTSVHWHQSPWSTSRLLSTAALLALVGGGIVIALLVYPGELSQISPGLHRWLYNRSAADYESKWDADSYRAPQFVAAVTSFARAAIENSGIPRVLDLGCGTGRGIRLIAASLPANTQLTGIDFSGEMLRRFAAWVGQQDPQLQGRIRLVERDLGQWAHDRADVAPFGLVLMLEVGEFLPDFHLVLRRVAEIVEPGGGLIMTRPAGLWSWFFIHRHQSRQRLARLLVSNGFDEPEFLPWRSRYEILFASRSKP